MSYGDNTNDGLGIVPAVVLAGVQGLVSLAKAIFGSKPPKPIDAATLAAYQKSMNTVLATWYQYYSLGNVVQAQAIRNGVTDATSGGKILATLLNSSDVNAQAIGKAAAQAMDQYAATYPPATVQYPEYSGPYGVPITKAQYDSYTAAGQGSMVRTRAQSLANQMAVPGNIAPAVSAPTIVPQSTTQILSNAAQGNNAVTKPTLIQSGVITDAIPMLLIGGVVMFIASRFGKGR